VQHCVACLLRVVTERETKQRAVFGDRSAGRLIDIDISMKYYNERFRARFAMRFCGVGAGIELESFRI
jgi:7,8-dihydro-6-hydroxymethylpterin-pyrophosphokinase